MFKKNKAPVVAEGQLEIADFRGNDIRKILHHDEWYFSVVDVVGVVAEAPNPRGYWSALKRKLVKEGMGAELYEDIVQLKMPGGDGKERSTDAANVEALFRIIQSIPSKKAERFKRWLAKVGYERLLEIDNPDIAIKRAIAEYRAKGRDDEWIEARVRSRLAREELTSEWGRRGVLGDAYGILTNVIQEGTFGLGVKRHIAFKGLKKHHNLRDHMTSLELLFTTLGERSTKDIAIADDAHGFTPNKQAAEKGGKVSGDARKALEEQTGQSVVSDDNFLPSSGDQKQLSTSANE